MRELLRAKAKAEMKRQGYDHINRYVSAEWRRRTGAYPNFRGVARQRKRPAQARQPVLRYS